ncbi:MAG: 7-dehydrocholesterol reductase, partial [Gammaproteobacteria bacterium]|nr:7-dehydrocholesterol reductase [Gammaproteobacteria bacterium]
MDSQHYNSSVRFLRHTILPLLLIVLCPPVVMLIWYTNVVLNGSLLQLWHLISDAGIMSTLYHIWTPVFFGSKIAWEIIGIFALTQLILMRIIPGEKYSGPVTPQGNVPQYKDNGFSCFIITVILFYLGAYPLKLFSASIVYNNFGAILSALNIFSLGFCLWLYLKGRFTPSTSDNSHSGNFIFDYYWGTELYPRV